MIEEIIALKERGYTLKEIANELDLSVGKVQYRLRKERSVQLSNNELVKRFKISKEIPIAYEIDRVVSLPQNPHCLYAYWDIQSTTQHMISHQLSKPWPELTKKLRVYDVSDLLFNGHNSHRFFDIYLPEMTNDWFIRDLEENRTYIVDVGVSSDCCDFFTIVRSEPVETPRTAHSSGRHEGPVKKWQSGNQQSPEWCEQFLTYSVYRLLK
jgi:hypothetical protein